MSLNVKKNTTLRYALNICALIMGLIAVICLVNSQKYIAGLMAQGLDPTSQFLEIIHYYCTSTAPYVFYAICLYSLGVIIKQVSPLPTNVTAATLNPEKLNSQSEDETDIVDSLLEELKPKN